MISPFELKQMIEKQFEIYTKGKPYEDALKESLLILEKLSTQAHPTSTQDSFYLFLHAFVIEIFNKLEALERKIQDLDP